MTFFSRLPLWVSLLLMLIGLLTAANVRELKRTKTGRIGAGVGISAGVVGFIVGLIQLGIYFEYWPIAM